MHTASYGLAEKSRVVARPVNGLCGVRRTRTFVVFLSAGRSPRSIWHGHICTDRAGYARMSCIQRHMDQLRSLA
eukprot:scaffold3524_cov275-Pinguiococcus_pyrenoidosus.AAC.2